MSAMSDLDVDQQDAHPIALVARLREVRGAAAAPNPKQVELARRRLYELNRVVKPGTHALAAERDPEMWLRFLEASADLYRQMGMPVAAARFDRSVEVQRNRVSAA